MSAASRRKARSSRLGRLQPLLSHSLPDLDAADRETRNAAPAAAGSIGAAVLGPGARATGPCRTGGESLDVGRVQWALWPPRDHPERRRAAGARAGGEAGNHRNSTGPSTARSAPSTGQHCSVVSRFTKRCAPPATTSQYVVLARSGRTRLHRGPDQGHRRVLAATGDRWAGRHRQSSQRPARPSDLDPARPRTTRAARAAKNNGALPPDLSLIAKAREGGPRLRLCDPERVSVEPPPKFQVFAGDVLQCLLPRSSGSRCRHRYSPDQVTFADKIPATVPQVAHDVASFLMWAAEPNLEQRHRIGFKVMLFLLVTTSIFTRRSVRSGRAFVIDVGRRRSVPARPDP